MEQFFIVIISAVMMCSHLSGGIVCSQCDSISELDESCSVDVAPTAEPCHPNATHCYILLDEKQRLLSRGCAMNDDFCNDQLPAECFLCRPVDGMTPCSAAAPKLKNGTRRVDDIWCLQCQSQLPDLSCAYFLDQDSAELCPSGSTHCYTIHNSAHSYFRRGCTDKERMCQDTFFNHVCQLCQPQGSTKEDGCIPGDFIPSDPPLIDVIQCIQCRASNPEESVNCALSKNLDDLAFCPQNSTHCNVDLRSNGFFSRFCSNRNVCHGKNTSLCKSCHADIISDELFCVPFLKPEPKPLPTRLTTFHTTIHDDRIITVPNGSFFLKISLVRVWLTAVVDIVLLLVAST